MTTISVKRGQDLLTAGAIARMIGATVYEVEAACASAHIQATMRQNGVYLFQTDQLDDIGQAILRLRERPRVPLKKGRQKPEAT